MKYLQSPRCRLRSFYLSDFQWLCDLMTNPRVMQFTGFGEVKEAPFIEEHLKSLIQQKDEELGIWALANQENELIGWFMLKETGFLVPEIGFMIREHFWGQGFAYEACKSLLDYWRDCLISERVIARCNTVNVASIKVLTKSGFNIFKTEDDILWWETWKSKTPY